MMLICVDKEAVMHDQIVAAPFFGIDVLGEEHRDVARRFANRASHHYDGKPDLSPAGLPLIGGSLLHADCRRAAVYPGGDHSIVTGVVEWVRTDSGAPLTYFRKSYGGFAP